MLSPYSRIPVVPVTIGFMAGILLFSVGIAWYWIAAVTVLAILLLLRPCRFYAFGILAIGVGWLGACVQAPRQLPENMHGVRLQLGAGVLDIKPSGDYCRLLVSADTINGIGLGTPLRVWISLLSDPGIAGINSRIKAEGYLRDVRRFDGLPYETDYAAFAGVDRVSAIMTVNSNGFEVLTQGEGFGERLRQYRMHISDAIYLSGLSQPAADFIVATVCGDDNNLSADSREMFRTLGLAHLLALSGFHVALFAGLISLLLYPLRLWRGFRRWRYPAVLAAVWAYVLISGMSASAVRAALMLTIALCGIMLHRPGASYNSLAMAALLMLVWNPYMLYSPGFQLSFAAVLGLLVFAERLNPFSRRRRSAHMLLSLITVPTAAVLGTALVSAVYFHSFPLLFLPANVVVTLIASVLTGGGAVLALLASLGVSCGALAWILNGLYSLAEAFCRMLMEIPLKEISGLYPQPLTILLLILATILFAVALYSRRNMPWILSATCVILSFGSQKLSAEEEPYGELYIPSHTAETRIIMRHGSAAALYTDTPLPAAHATLAACRHRYERWLQMRGCENNFVLLDSVTVCNNPGRDGSLVHVGPYSLWIANGNDDILPLQVDYVVVGMNKDIDFTAVNNQMQPKGVILTSALSAKRRRRYENSCRSIGLPVHNAADSTFCLRW